MTTDKRLSPASTPKTAPPPAKPAVAVTAPIGRELMSDTGRPDKGRTDKRRGDKKR